MRTTIVLTATVLLAGGPIHAAEPTDAEKEAIEKVRELGGHVLEIAQNDDRLEVAYHLADAEVTGEHLAPLAALKGRLAWLNLRGTAVTDEDLARLEGLTELTRLHLEKTKIGDKGLAHLKGLTKLQYLNLYGTQVSDAGLAHLAKLKDLEKLYIWKSKVTAEGVAKVKEMLPEVKVIPDLAAQAEEKEKEASEKDGDDKGEEEEGKNKGEEEEKGKGTG